MSKKEFMTKEEFSKAIYTELDSWIFITHDNAKPPTFWKEQLDDGEIEYYRQEGDKRY